jgi:hypothetical protein
MRLQLRYLQLLDFGRKSIFCHQAAFQAQQDRDEFFRIVDQSTRGIEDLLVFFFIQKKCKVKHPLHHPQAIQSVLP